MYKPINTLSAFVFDKSEKANGANGEVIVRYVTGKVTEADRLKFLKLVNARAGKEEHSLIQDHNIEAGTIEALDA